MVRELTIQRTRRIKFVEVTLDETLTCVPHIGKHCKATAFKFAGGILGIYGGLILNPSYAAVVRPYFMYGTVVWYLQIGGFLVK